MSNDLISRKEVLGIIEPRLNTSKEGTLERQRLYSILTSVREMPTAYDVDKVMERLKEINEDDDICEKFKNKDRRHCKNAKGCFDCAICESIEIVKSGGILKG